MTPYYQHDGITIYCGDCREILPELPKVDLVLTDIPYGVGLGSTAGSGGKHGLVRGAYASYDDSFANYCSVIVPALELALSMSERGAVFCGQHIQELPKANAIGGIYCPAGSGRHPWGFKTFLPVMFYGNAPDIHKGAKPNTLQSTATAEKNGHPCPKPVEWMQWLVNLGSREGETILDPFMGSGTTLVAAKRLGRQAIGIEIEERYCEIAARRVEAERLTLFEALPENGNLWEAQ